MTIRAAIYARVSTDEQAERGYSLPSQIEACRDYAAKRGMTVVAEFQEDYTGSKLSRPEFSKLRKLVKNREIDAVIVYSADRLTRSLAHSLILREEFEAAGIERHNVLRGKLNDSADGRMVENIEGVFSEYERERIRERMARGKFSKARRGLIVGNGPPPYGYSYVDGRYEIVEKEAEVIRQIYHLFVHGDESGKLLHCNAISYRLSLLKIPAPGDKRARAKRMRGPGIWRRPVIESLIKRELYKGIYRYGLRIGAGGDGKERRALEDTVTIAVPPIVTEQLWDAAQKQMLQNKARNKRNRLHEYMLSGHIFCECGGRWCGTGYKRIDGRLYTYYGCASSAGVHRKIEGRRCPQKYVRTELLDRLVWGYIHQLLISNDFEGNLRAAQAQMESNLEPSRSQIETLDSLIKSCETEVQSLLEIRDQLPAGGIAQRSLLEKLKMLDEQYTALTRERASAAATREESHSLTDDSVRSALQFREAVMSGLESATYDDKRRILNLLDVRIEIPFSRQITVRCVIPTEPFLIDADALKS